MKKLLILFSALFALSALGQSTTITSTIIDPLGNSWGYGTVTAVFRNSPGASNQPVWSGGTLNPIPPTVALSSSGTFTMTLPSTNYINPSGGMWTFSVCPNSSQNCAVFNTAVIGATLDIEPLITAANAWPTALVNSTPIAKVYNVNQTYAPPLNQGGMLYDTQTQSMLVYTSTGWQPFATVGSGVPVLTNPAGSQTITQPANTFFNFITSGTGGVNINGNAVPYNNYPNPFAFGNSITAPEINGDYYVSASSELSAQINADVAAIGGGTGRIHLPPCASCTWTGNVILPSSAISLVGTGVLSTRITCTYAGDCLDIYPVYGLANHNANQISDFTMTGNGAAGQNIIHGRDLNGYNLSNLYLDGASEAGGSCLFLEDYAYWTEGNRFYHVSTGYNCAKGIRFYANSATNSYCPASNPSLYCSFGYNYMDFSGNPTAGQDFISMEGPGQMYYGKIQANCNAAGTSASPAVVINMTTGFSWQRSWGDVSCEENGSGDILWKTDGTTSAVNLLGHFASDQSLVNSPSTYYPVLNDGGSGADYTQSTYVGQSGQPYDFHAGAAYLIPSYSTNNFEAGVGLFGRFQYSSGLFTCIAGGPHNGCSFMLENDVAESGESVYVIPDTATGLNQTFTYAQIAPYLILTIAPNASGGGGYMAVAGPGIFTIPGTTSTPGAVGVYQPSLPSTGNNYTAFQVGTASSTLNSAIFGFVNKGGSGSLSNAAIMGPTGADDLYVYGNSAVGWGTTPTQIPSSSAVPQVGTPTAGQAACIKASGPPVVIGYCSTVVSSTGACTCN